MNPIHLRHVVAAVCDAARLTPAQLAALGRASHQTAARTAVVHLARTMCTHQPTYQAIAEAVGLKSHVSMLSLHRRANLALTATPPEGNLLAVMLLIEAARKRINVALAFPSSARKETA